MTGRSAARWLAPLLAAPHTAVAIGLAFVLAPSGWIARLLAPLVGWVRPPDLALINDPWDIAFILGLMIKEIPFLLLVMLAALNQIPVQQHMAVARGLGYRRSVDQDHCAAGLAVDPIAGSGRFGLSALDGRDGDNSRPLEFSGFFGVCDASFYGP